jgi:hypothetical protein
VTICLAFVISSLLLSPAGPQDAAVQDGPAAVAPRPELPQILAFDLPPDLRSERELAKIRSFVVGYFQGESAEPRWMLEVPPNLTRVLADGSVRLLLPLANDLPAGVYSARLKIRTASADSDWSAPSPSFRLPEFVKRKARTTASATRAAKKPRPLNLDPALAEAVGPLLPKGMELADAIEGFQKPQHFLGALFVSRNLKLELAAVKEKIFEKPGKTRSLSSVIRELRPDRDARAEARKASSQAKALAGEAGRKRRSAQTKPPESADAYEWLPARGLLSRLQHPRRPAPGWDEAAVSPGLSAENTSLVALHRWHEVGKSDGVPDSVGGSSAPRTGGRA